MIRILCVGKIKEVYLDDLINDYKKRISKYHKLEIIEVKDNINIHNETKELMKYLNKNNDEYIIALTIEGNTYNSENFAIKLAKLVNTKKVITFVIGGSNGLESEIINNVNECISFSNFTFPHGLFRGILLEQIYRSFKINNNETYHK